MRGDDIEYAQNAFGSSVSYPSKIAQFDVQSVQEICALDKKGEFFVVVIGTTGEQKKFKTKSKFFKRLP